MKPDWKDAPKWAKWLALDGDGSWWWYAAPPSWEVDDCAWVADGRNIKAGCKRIRASLSTDLPSPDKTLEYRP